MSKPRFALAPLLEHYRHTEECCRLRTAASVRACDAARGAVANLEEQLRDSGQCDVAHLAAIDRALVARTRMLETSNEEHGRAREALIAASRNRAVLERLEARQRAQWLQRERRREDREAGW